MEILVPMTPSKKPEKKVQQAVMALRKETLQRGLLFMINFDLLPPAQCYLEFTANC